SVEYQGLVGELVDLGADLSELRFDILSTLNAGGQLEHLREVPFEFSQPHQLFDRDTSRLGEPSEHLVVRCERGIQISSGSDHIGRRVTNIEDALAKLGAVLCRRVDAGVTV